MSRSPNQRRQKESNISQRYQEEITKEVIGELNSIIKKLKNGEFIIRNHGSWVSGNDSTIYYKYSVIPRD